MEHRVRLVMFYHSLVSDWNHGNAHFLRGVVRELLERGHAVRVFEPRDGWSRTNLLQDHGADAVAAFRAAYPALTSEAVDLATLDLDEALRDADTVLVHEWNDPELVARLGVHRATRGIYRLLFHDTHHRSVTDPGSMAAYDLRHYDGVLAFGDVIRDLYVANGWASRAWTWHEAADTNVFYPRPANDTSATERRAQFADSSAPPAAPAHADYGDVVWIGNWGDEERTAELDEFLLQPVRDLGLRATVYGVRYPADAQARLAASGVSYRGWLANTAVPAVFARYKVTVHIPRRPYLEVLPGIPTIRPFEALACGIPLICARWEQTGGLFTPGEDFLVARDGREMTSMLAALLSSDGARHALATHGRETVLARHTCAHRVDELLSICDRIPLEAAAS